MDRHASHAYGPGRTQYELGGHLVPQGLILYQFWRSKGGGQGRNASCAGRLGLHKLLVIDDYLFDRIARNLQGRNEDVLSVVEFHFAPLGMNSRWCCELGTMKCLPIGQ